MGDRDIKAVSVKEPLPHSWYVRRAIALMALFAIILGIAGYAVHRYYQRREEEREWEQLRLVYNMSSYYREDMGEGRGGMYDNAAKPVSEKFKERKDPDMWFEDPVKPGKESELRHVISIYNRLHPREITSVEEFRRYYGRDWQKHVRERFVGKSYARGFAHWCYQEADLVYKYDMPDIHGIVHHRGDKVEDLRFVSNYRFLLNKDSRSFYYLELRSDFEAGR